MKFLSINARLAMIVGLLLVTIAGLIVGESWSFRESMLQERREKIFDINTSIVAIAKKYDALVAAGKMTLPEAQEAVKTAARAMRWGANDYISIYDYDGLTLVHGNPKYEGVNRMDFVDGTGVRSVEKQIGIAKAGGGFMSILIPRAGQTLAVPKINNAMAYGGSAHVTLILPERGDDPQKQRFITATVRVDLSQSSDGAWRVAQLTVLKRPHPDAPGQ